MVIANHDYPMELASDHSSLDLATNSFGTRVNQVTNLLTKNVISFVALFITQKTLELLTFHKENIKL